MSTVRSLANLHCITCGETTMHRDQRCIHCTEPNQQSGNPPLPRPVRSKSGRSPEGEQRRIEALRAHHAAKRARNEQLSKRGLG